MSESVAEVPVGDDEWLARYILRREHVRRDGTIKPDPFIPYKHTELSVTRHLGLSDLDIWSAGIKVAEQFGSALHGRADAQARLYRRQRLGVEAAPLEGNPNHANVTRWPPDKPSQKEIALLIAREAVYKPKP